ncbi:acetyltransferase [Facklamia sp. P12937]|uniref:acetyltransferase n=1 Tax=Facklamia sp. P12937 TaxID=3421949 RepID=UPI003D172D1A
MIEIIIIGAGGYAKSVIDSINKENYKIVGFIDDRKKGTHLGLPILSSEILSIKNFNNYLYFIAIGDNIKRKKWYEELKRLNCGLINIIDKTSIVSPNAKLGEGCFIGKLAIINSMVNIGNNCVINTKALLEHGVKVENHVNISTNSTVNGDVIIKDGAFIGSGSIVNGQLMIEENSIVGSGAVVIRDVMKNSTVVGIPAKPLNISEED